MILCIAEKPSVAGDIARILGARAKKDGYYEGNGYWVSWALGHLCCLKEPDDYAAEWKRWNIAVLPIIPAKYEIKLLDSPAAKKQFKVLNGLLAKCEYVINCGDSGQEGELIQRWILQQAKYKKGVKRLWISSLTDESIRQGFNNLKPGADYDSLYYAAMCRACGDWLLGMNATRLYTLKYGGYGCLLSIGRVQTPTLAMIVQRDNEIAHFIPQDYFLVSTLYKDTRFSLNSEKKNYSLESDAQAIIDAIRSRPFVVDDVKAKRESEAPPALFDLTALQVECNRRFGFSAEFTLKIAQSLYEKKVTTYPRTDSRCLTNDMYPKCAAILNSIESLQDALTTIRGSKLIKRPKVFNDAKVSDHHAIIPTGQKPNSLSETEQKTYDLICRRFAVQFFPDAIYDKTEVLGHAGNYPFRAVGKILASPGWRYLFGVDSMVDNEKEDENQSMSPMNKGESGPHVPKIIKKTTQPPKPFTEGTLLKAMETAGKMVDDEELAEALKANGIGRPSTRAAIIETLLRRQYITKQGKSIVSTSAGRQLIGLIHDENLTSPALTGIWEGRLRQIERCNYSAATFMSELKQMVVQLIASACADNSGVRITMSETKYKFKNKTNKKPNKGKK